MSIKDQLKAIRAASGLSRPKFAALIGVPQTTLKNYECGYREAVPVTLLQQMYAALPEQRQDILAIITGERSE